MKLTEAIKQDRFKNEMHKAVVNILYTSSWLNYTQSAVFKDFGLTMKQFNILRILKGQYPKAATVNLLIDRMIDKSSNASRIVDKLVEKGYVERKTCPEDRRRVDVIISEAGMKIVDQATKKLDESETFRDSLSEKEAQELNRLLDKLRTKE
jgi:DNA-binding MarR family transcriptional regulator